MLHDTPLRLPGASCDTLPGLQCTQLCGQFLEIRHPKIYLGNMVFTWPVFREVCERRDRCEQSDAPHLHPYERRGIPAAHEKEQISWDVRQRMAPGTAGAKPPHPQPKRGPSKLDPPHEPTWERDQCHCMGLQQRIWHSGGPSPGVSMSGGNLRSAIRAEKDGVPSCAINDQKSVPKAIYGITAKTSLSA